MSVIRALHVTIKFNLCGNETLNWNDNAEPLLNDSTKKMTTNDKVPVRIFQDIPISMRTLVSIHVFHFFLFAFCWYHYC